MGFSHYWVRSDRLNKKKFAAAIRDCRKVVDWFNRSGQKVLAVGRDKPDLTPVDETGIVFNGVGENGFETFRVMFDADELLGACKTDRRPYDVAVCACLVILNRHLGQKFKVASDGEDEDEGWSQARDLCMSLVGYGDEFSLYPHFTKCGIPFDGKPNDLLACGEYWFCSGLKMDVGRRGQRVSANDKDELLHTRFVSPSSKSTEMTVCVRHCVGLTWSRYGLAKTRAEGRWLATVALIERIALHAGANEKLIRSFIDRMKESFRDWTPVLVFCDRLDDEGLSSKRIRILLPKNTFARTRL